MKPFRIFSLCLSFMLLPVLAAAAEAERPEINIGTSWTYKKVDAYTGVVTATWKNVVKEKKDTSFKVARFNMNGAPTGSQWLSQNLGVESISNGNMNVGNLLNFPLNMNDSWTSRHYWADGSASGVEEIVYTVSGKEEITVEAGVFDAIKVTGKGEWKNYARNSTGVLLVTMHYSPIAKTPVRIERRQMFSYGAPANREIVELISYEVK